MDALTCARDMAWCACLAISYFNFLFSELIITVWWGGWEARKCICCLMLGPFLPPGCELVCHDTCAQLLQPWVFNLIQTVGIEYGDERVVVRNDCELVDSCEEGRAFLDGPRHCQALQLNYCIPACFLHQTGIWNLLALVPSQSCPDVTFA